jgi:lysozyme
MDWPIHGDGVELIQACEGFYPRPYVCPAGVWTVGWGATRGLDGQRVTRETPEIDRREGEELLARDLHRFSAAVDRLVKVVVGPRQRAALTSFAFNLGSGHLRNSTLLVRVNGDQWEDVPNQFMKWIYGGGRPLPGLVRRRRLEADLWQSEA